MPGVEAKAKLKKQMATKISTKVQFAVLSAKDLPPSSSHWCAAPTAVSAYAAFAFGNVLGRTGVEKQTCSPVWNMEMMDLGPIESDSEEDVVITVYHHSLISKNRLISKLSIPISRMLSAGKGNHQRWVRLPCKGRRDKEHPPLLLVKYNID